MGEFHIPPTCDPTLADKASQRDCVEPGCSADGCNYTLSVSIDRGTQRAYTLQVLAQLYSSLGPEHAEQWTYKRCADSEVCGICG